MRVNLSKSAYLKGLQCHKALWLNKHKKQLASKTENSALQVGNVVGELARDLFSGGVLVEFGDFSQMLNTTQELLNSENVIYEATFSNNGMFSMLDILVKNGEVWDIYEVKSSTEVKNIHIIDSAYQRFVAAQNIAIGQSYLAHINNQYQRNGALDLQQLFTIENITDRVESILPSVQNNFNNMQKMLTQNEPEIEIGKHCDNPYTCDFKDYCWANIPKPSVFNLYRLSADKKFAYAQQGKISYEDLQNEPLNATQKLQISGKEFIDKEKIKKFVNSAEFPINFFDFETFQNAIPRFDNQRPYQQIPFQYSLHILDKNGSLTHKEFLGDEKIDPRENLIQQMLKDINPTGTIIAFNQSFEQSVIKNLAYFSPKNAPELLALNTRFMDLLVPFRSLDYYHPDFNGSFSIKSVLPAMFPNDDELDYKKLGQVQNGGDAMEIFANLHLEKNPEKVEQIKQDLLKYCYLDTLAMVRIWQALIGKASKKYLPN